MREQRTKQSVSLTPKLRFKEFEGDWEIKKLGNIATFSKGKNITKADIVDDGELECIRYGELYTNYNEIIVDIKSKTNLKADDLILSENNDVIIPASGETRIDIATASCVLKEGVALGGDLNIIKSKINGVFLSYYLNSKKKIDIARLSQGISVVHLYSSQLKTLKLNLPKDKEQQKIATFLTSVDTKLQQLNAKKSALENYKKGAMQQIFSQQIRFKPDVINTNVIATTKDEAISLNEFPDWEVKKLGEVCYVNPKNSELPNSFIYVDLESVDKGRLVLQNKINLEKAPSRAQRVLEVNDILFQTVRPYQMNNLYFDKKGDYIASTGYAQLRTKESSMFLYQLLHTHHFVNNVLERCTGTSYPAINSNDLTKIKIKIPSLKEQQKIATYLSAIDTKIESVQTQIEKTQLFKKGLLQQLFV
ncbi:hypothetical protein BTO16_01355 [Polaribacter glomeratus]|uniref:Type I restriction modification DNA specificity domain-containing protein n=1 Tax=Polaribacter glomeratus TaxID=102 RepID=A0A2S7WZX4_9FLAO|nr:hypothetical protein BTO16_01355 [Polaribacter glomeratus]